MIPQNLGGFSVERHPPLLVCLQRRLNEHTVLIPNRPSKPDRFAALIKRQRRPPHRADLASPSAGGHRGPDQCTPIQVVPRFPDDSRSLLGSRWLRVRLGCRRRQGLADRADADPPPSDSPTEGPQAQAARPERGRAVASSRGQRPRTRGRGGHRSATRRCCRDFARFPCSGGPPCSDGNPCLCHIPCHAIDEPRGGFQVLPGQTWSRRSGSNRRPTAYKAVVQRRLGPLPATTSARPVSGRCRYPLGWSAFRTTFDPTPGAARPCRPPDLPVSG